MKERYDKEEIYCRRLGHNLNFSYCRSEHNGLPCPLIFDCWYTRLDIGAYMRKNFTPDELPYLTQAAPSKMSTLLELIQKAQNKGKVES